MGVLDLLFGAIDTSVLAADVLLSAVAWTVATIFNFFYALASFLALTVAPGAINISVNAIHLLKQILEVLAHVSLSSKFTLVVN